MVLSGGPTIAVISANSVGSRCEITWGSKLNFQPSGALERNRTLSSPALPVLTSISLISDSSPAVVSAFRRPVRVPSDNWGVPVSLHLNGHHRRIDALCGRFQ